MMNMFVGATAAAATSVRYRPNEVTDSDLLRAFEAREQAQEERDAAQLACWRWEARDPWPSNKDGITDIHRQWADRKEAFRTSVDIDGKEERLEAARDRVTHLRESNRAA